MSRMDHYTLTERLIQEVQKRPVLYLLAHSNHHAKRTQAWIEIKNELFEEVHVLKLKWKNLKDTYRKYKHAQRDKNYRLATKLHNWVWAEHMSFMDEDTITVEVPEDTEEVMLPEEEISIKEEQVEQEQEVEVEHEETYDSIQQLNKKKKKYNECIKKKVIRKRKLYQQNEVAVSEKREVKCDGTDLLFLGYADTFKKLSKRKRVKVKFDIAKILMAAEISDLDDD